MKTINLEDIIYQCVGIHHGAKNTTPMDYGECKFIMKEFAKQLLELAAENVEIVYEKNSTYGSYDTVVDKQSILDTINQIK